MHDNLTRFGFLALLLMAYGCAKEKITTQYDSGKLKEEYEVDQEGRKDGTYLLYFENGQRREKAFYRKDTLVGTRILYFENGKPEVEEPYDSNGILNGTYKQYYPEGGLKLEQPYVANVISGMIRVYYPGGQIKEEVTMQENQENGPFAEYHPNGKMEWKGAYKNGDDEFGWLEQYDSLGQLIKVMRCDTPGICRTKWKTGMPPLAR